MKTIQSTDGENDVRIYEAAHCCDCMTSRRAIQSEGILTSHSRESTGVHNKING